MGGMHEGEAGDFNPSELPPVPRISTSHGIPRPVSRCFLRLRLLPDALSRFFSGSSFFPGRVFTTLPYTAIDEHATVRPASERPRRLDTRISRARSIPMRSYPEPASGGHSQQGAQRPAAAVAPPRRKQGGSKKLANGLVALSSAAVIAVYAAGYVRTAPAAASVANVS